jgi:hypothetical protein
VTHAKSPTNENKTVCGRDIGEKKSKWTLPPVPTKRLHAKPECLQCQRKLNPKKEAQP